MSGNSILVIKLYAIGDYIMSIPALRFLRERYPDDRIDLLIGSTLDPLITISAPVDGFIKVDERILTSRFRHLSIVPIVRRLRRAGYSRAYLLHRALPLRLMLRATGIPERIGQGSKMLGLTSTIPFELDHAEHDAQRYARLFGWSEGEELPRARIEPAEESISRAAALTGNGAFVTVNPGGGRSSVRTLNSARWHVERFLEIIQWLDSVGIRSVIIGSAGDRPGLELLLDNLPSSSLNLVGKTSLSDVAAVISLSRLMITNDSGLAHVAGAVGTPTVTIFGPSDPTRTGVFPPSSLHRIIRPEGVACHPCQPGKAGLTCNGEICMGAIETTAVRKEVEWLLQQDVMERRVDHQDSLLQ